MNLDQNKTQICPCYMTWNDPYVQQRAFTLATFTSPVLKVAIKVSNRPTAPTNEGERLSDVKNRNKLFPAVIFTL